MTGQGQGSPPGTGRRDADRHLRGTLARRSIPGLLRRLDAWLLLQHPLVWRTRVHLFVWFSLILGNPLFFALGWIYPVSRTSVPTAASLDALVTMLQLLGALVLALWTLGQARAPLPELRARGYLVTGGLYAACILMILLNSLAFAWPLVYRIADVTPDQEFTAEYDLHARYDFWCCHPDIDQTLVERHRQAIDDSLRRYGLSTDYSVGSGYLSGCDAGRSCLKYDYQTPLSLGLVLSSIQHAKQFRALDGPYYERYVLSIPAYLVASMALGGVLLLLSTALGIRNRHMGQGENFRSLLRIRPWRPRFIQQLDRYLLIHRPLLWTTGLHVFPYLILVYGTLPFAALFLASRLVFVTTDLVLYLLGGLIIPPVTWGLWRARAALDEPTIRGNQRSLLLYCLAAFGPQVLTLLLFWSTGLMPSSTNESMYMIVLAGISALYVVGLVFLGKYLKAPLVLIGALIGVAALWGGVYLLDKVQGLSGTESAVLFYLLWIAWVLVSLAMTRIHGPSKASGLLVAICIMSFPLLGPFTTAITAAALRADKIEWFVPFSVATVPLFLITAIPSIQVLIRYRYYPQREP